MINALQLLFVEPPVIVHCFGFRLNYVVTSDHRLCFAVLVCHVRLCFVLLALDIHRVLYVVFFFCGVFPCGLLRTVEGS